MNTAETPFVSLVMAVLNEAPFIERSLKSVLAQDYPADRMEVLVADGLSTDGTRAALESFQSGHSRLRILDNPKRTTATGLNLAIAHARGEVIVRMDGHSELPPDYVRHCVSELSRTGAEHVGSAITTIGESEFGKAVALAMSTPFGVGGARFRYADREEWVDTVFLGAWPRSIFERIGMFDESMKCNEDDEFNYRLLDHGGRILMSPPLRVKYTPRDTPSALATQYFRYGFWKVRVFQKHPRQMRASHFVPPLFSAVLLISACWAAASTAGAILFAATAGAYLAANVAASLIAGLRHGWKRIRFLPLIYAVLHLSYGFGFLAGLARFAGRWGDRTGAPDLNKDRPEKAEVPT